MLRHRWFRYLAVFPLAWTLHSGSLAFAETEATQNRPGENPGPTVPPQISYDVVVTTHGLNVGTAVSGPYTLLGSITFACLDQGAPALVGRDSKNVVIFETVLHSPPAEDLALRPYSHLFSELQRIAWNRCNPNRQIATGAQRKVEQKGALPVGKFTFPNQIEIQDALGSINCDASPSDKTGRSAGCQSHVLPQPFVSTLTRRAAQLEAAQP